ncbi:homeodomain GLABROUS 2 [Perilla frutescens var. hirtella]|uniref:Homeodomain GLABROUS 2 n=1 Tax=Perilla frutescens var. hirtella TaxID=608512 RepID=A0AAD4J4U5_PERFH|nr:homeodomain GLABROUS 2 [Perilla frutescens var. hirtella]
MAGGQHFDANSNLSEGEEDRRINVEEVDNKSSDEDADIDLSENRHHKRKRYHRHTLHQIKAMEAFFKECPHPDAKQRNELSQALGLEPLQIKFWFQNKRTQMKSKHEREQNKHLRAENEKLRVENMRYKEALSNASCPACGRMAAISDVSLDERQLRMENARLREEIDRISAVAASYVGKPFALGHSCPTQLSPATINDKKNLMN